MPPMIPGGVPYRIDARHKTDYNPRNERKARVIELTERQVEALEHPEASPPKFLNPQTQETFVLLRVEEYKRLKDDEYDDSPWTREELQTLAWEAGKQAGWDDMNEYDDAAEKPRVGLVALLPLKRRTLGQ